jgi:hypothetical protein
MTKPHITEIIEVIGDEKLGYTLAKNSADWYGIYKAVKLEDCNETTSCSFHLNEEDARKVMYALHKCALENPNGVKTYDVLCTNKRTKKSYVKALFRKKEDALKYVDENNKSSRTHTFALVEDNINN